MLTRLIDEVRTGATVPWHLVVTEDLQHMPSIGTEIAFLQIPELATRTISNVRRTDKDRLVIVGRRAILVEVTVVVAPGI